MEMGRSRRTKLPNAWPRCSIAWTPMAMANSTRKNSKPSRNGCEAGNVLLGIRSDGKVSGCSFLQSEGLHVFDLAAQWETDPHLETMRSFDTHAPEPCRSCAYLSVCKGGCHAVAIHLTGSAHVPDPDCPRVVRWLNGGEPP